MAGRLPLTAPLACGLRADIPITGPARGHSTSDTPAARSGNRPHQNDDNDPRRHARAILRTHGAQEDSLMTSLVRPLVCVFAILSGVSASAFAQEEIVLRPAKTATLEGAWVKVS